MAYDLLDGHIDFDQSVKWAMRTVFFHLFLCCLQHLVSSTSLECTQSEVAGCKTEDHRLNCHISGDAGVFSSVYNLG